MKSGDINDAVFNFLSLSAINKKNGPAQFTNRMQANLYFGVTKALKMTGLTVVIFRCNRVDMV